MRKQPGIGCRHLIPVGGCGIHATRPDVCRRYYCAWHFIDELDETWRPDLSGVLLEFQDIDIPAGFEGKMALRMSIVGPIETVFKRGFVNLVVLLVERKMPAFLCIRGPVGHHPVNTFLNNVLEEHVRNRDTRAIVLRLNDLLKDLNGIEYLPARFKHMDAPDFGTDAIPAPMPG
jgi:hypothetical protein